MAKPTRYATPICAALTVLAAIGILLGIGTGNAIWTIAMLLPTVGYEAYRTEGESTKWASFALLGVFVAELFLIIFKIDVDLVSFLGETEKTVGGYTVPLGDIKVVGAALMGVCSLILFTRTRGVYTRWLAAVIIVSSLAVIYVLAPEAFPDVLRSGLDQVG